MSLEEAFKKEVIEALAAAQKRAAQVIHVLRRSSNQVYVVESLGLLATDAEAALDLLGGSWKPWEDTSDDPDDTILWERQIQDLDTAPAVEVGPWSRLSCRAIWQLTGHAMATAEQWEILDDPAVCTAMARSSGFMARLQRRARRTADRLAGRLLAEETPTSFAEDAEVMRSILADRIERGVIDRERARAIADQIVSGTPPWRSPRRLTHTAQARALGRTIYAGLDELASTPEARAAAVGGTSLGIARQLLGSSMPSALLTGETLRVAGQDGQVQSVVIDGNAGVAAQSWQDLIAAGYSLAAERREAVEPLNAAVAAMLGTLAKALEGATMERLLTSMAQELVPAPETAADDAPTA